MVKGAFMQITAEERDNGCAIVVRGSLAIDTVTRAKTPLLAALARADHIDLDLSGVERFDTAGLQLLLLLRREARGAGRRVRLIDVSAPVQATMRRCAAERWFDMDATRGDAARAEVAAP